MNMFRQMLLEEHQIELPADMDTHEFRATVTSYPIGNCELTFPVVLIMRFAS